MIPLSLEKAHCHCDWISKSDDVERRWFGSASPAHPCTCQGPKVVSDQAKTAPLVDGDVFAPPVRTKLALNPPLDAYDLGRQSFGNVFRHDTE